MVRPSTLISHWHAAGSRLRGRMLAIVQTATAAVAAWYLAVLLLPDPRPAFAAIAAVIAVGATHGQRAGRALQLVGGVVLGLTVADLIIQLIGTGTWQIGVLVVLAMAAAVALGGGEILIVDAGVSAILLVALDPGAADGFSPNRIIEGMIGGAVALAVSSFLFPPDPALGPGRAAQAVFAELGRALERLAGALEERDPRAAEHALNDARAIDPLMRTVHDELEAGREVVRLAAPRREARTELERYETSLGQVDYAVRNTRVLARHVLSLVREGSEVPENLPVAVRELSHSVWELAAAYDSPSRVEPARLAAVHAAGEAASLPEGSADLVMVGGQVRSVAVDLVRAAELVGGEPEAPSERPTQELLAAA